MTADPSPNSFTPEYVRRPESLGYVKVLEVLREWDPIGVFDMDEDWPRDEYDSYAAPLVRMLDAAETREEIVEHLGRIAVDSMGLGSFDRLHTTACVSELIQFWKSWKEWRAAASPPNTELDVFEWHVLDATADAWESLDQIEPHVRTYCAEVSRLDVAEKILNLKALHLFEEMQHEHLEREAACANDLLVHPTEHWFRMTPVARMLWNTNRSRYTPD